MAGKIDGEILKLNVWLSNGFLPSMSITFCYVKFRSF